MITLRGISKTFSSGTQAVAGASLRVDAGEIVSLLGPSGCGKSTLLRIIAGLTSPTSGEAIAPWLPRGSERSARLGFVLQEPTLLPWCNVWKNVYLPLRLARQRRRDAAPAVDAALNMVGLTEFAAAYPRELSGGMKMRVSVARALAVQPLALLLDEPFGALDEITRNRIDDDLLRLWALQKWATLFVTHSVYESVYLSNRVLVMSPRPGRVIDEIEIDLPQPRIPAVRGMPRFTDLCQRASAALAAAMQSRETAL